MIKKSKKLGDYGPWAAVPKKTNKQMISVCSIISVISASYYSEDNLHGFVKHLNFAICGNVHYSWHWMLLSMVLANRDTSVKILSTAPAIIWIGKIKVFVL